jgi:hypothetical protein
MAKERKNANGLGLGIAGLVLGIVAVMLAVIPFIGLMALIPGIAGMILSIIGLVQASKSNSPKGLILAGLIISTFSGLFAPIWTITVAQRIRDRIENATKDIEKDANKLDSLNKNFEGEMQKLKDKNKANDVHVSDYDKLIKDYEVFLKDLDKIAKKAKAGDLDAITEFSTVSLKVNNVSSKLTRLATSLTPEQVKEFGKLQENYDSIMNNFNLKK